MISTAEKEELLRLVPIFPTLRPVLDDFNDPLSLGDEEAWISASAIVIDDPQEASTILSKFKNAPDDLKSLVKHIYLRSCSRELLNELLPLFVPFSNLVRVKFEECQRPSYDALRELLVTAKLTQLSITDFTQDMEEVLAEVLGKNAQCIHLVELFMDIFPSPRLMKALLHVSCLEVLFWFQPGTDAEELLILLEFLEQRTKKMRLVGSVDPSAAAAIVKQQAHKVRGLTVEFDGSEDGVSRLCCALQDPACSLEHVSLHIHGSGMSVAYMNRLLEA